MGRTACTEPQCLYKGALYLFICTCKLYTKTRNWTGNTRGRHELRVSNDMMLKGYKHIQNTVVHSRNAKDLSFWILNRVKW